MHINRWVKPGNKAKLLMMFIALLLPLIVTTSSKAIVGVDPSSMRILQMKIRK
jgi:hypothetical protein